MKPFVLLITIILILAALLGGLAIVSLGARSTSPSETSSALVTTSTNSPSPSVTSWPTLTLTRTTTPIATATVTSSVTPTNTLSTRVLVVTAINADVTLIPPSYTQPVVTTTVTQTQVLRAPAMPVAPLPPDGENADLIGWYQRDTTEPSVQQIGAWQTYTQTSRAIQRQYVYSDADGARLVYKFIGAGLRIHYAAFYNYGEFEVVIDGQPRDSIDSYSPKALNPQGEFLTTDIYTLGTGSHTLEIVRTGRKAVDSGGSFVAIDAIDIYKSGPQPTIAPTQLPPTLVPTSSPQAAQRIQIVAAPPTVRPTPTQGVPVITAVDFSVAYDVNNNKIFDQLEGVQGLSVRLVRADTNLVIAAGYTNAEGFVHLEGTGNVPLRLVVPYLGKYWDIQNPSSTVKVQFIVPAVNMPGLIP
ncbi:MAG: hypothetical protein KF716_25620 [Anaerolineae bacterium]|nr:hypothetical protein [Anaerolineae bacterium]